MFHGNAVIISATRSAQPYLEVPFAVESFNIQTIQQGNKLVSLEETLQVVPGLSVNNRNNFALGDRISVRGIGARASFGIRGIKILLDDIPLTMPDGQAQLTNLDLGSTGRIEIIKGPSSSLYGNAAGGVIKIETAEEKKSFIFEPQVVIGSYDFLKVQAKIAGNYNSYNYLLNINKFNSSGFRENSAAEYWALNSINRYRFSDNLKVSTVLNFYDAPYALNPSSLSRALIKKDRTSSRYFVKQQGSGEKTRHGQGGININYKPSESGILKLTVYGLGRLVQNPIPSRIIELERFAGGVRTNYSDKSTFSGKELNWTLGIDAETQSDERIEFANNGLPSEKVDNIKNFQVLKSVKYGDKLQQQDEQVYSIGPFANFNFAFLDNWIFTLGGRYDHYVFDVTDHFLSDGSDDSGTITMNRMSPMSGLLYRFHPAQSLYINYSTAFQTPTTSELGNTPTGQNGLNDDLKPEKIENFEIGVKGFLTEYNIFYQSVLYYMQIEDMLIPYQSDPSEEIFYRNAGSAKNMGLEFQIDWQMNKNVNLQLSYALMDFVFSDYVISNPASEDALTINLKDNKIPGVAPSEFYASLTYKHPNSFFTVIQFKWHDAYFTNDYNGGGPDDNLPRDTYINKMSSVFNIRTGRTWFFDPVNLQIFMGIDNVFNTRYNSSVVPNALNNNFFEPAAGRTWHSGIKLTF